MGLSQAQRSRQLRGVAGGIGATNGADRVAASSDTRSHAARSPDGELLHGDPVQLLVTVSFEPLGAVIGIGLRIERRYLDTIPMIVLSPDDPSSERPVHLHVTIVEHAAGRLTATRRGRPGRGRPRLRGRGDVRGVRASRGVGGVAVGLVGRLPTDHGVVRARRESAAALRDLEGQTLRSLQLPQLRDDRAGFLRLLQAVLAFRGVPVWSNQLAHLVEGEEELELDCPWRGEYHLAWLSPSEGFTLRGHLEGEEVVRATEPAGPASLDDVGGWLYRTATQHAQPPVAVQVVHLFGRSRCTACDEGFRVSDGVLSLRGQFADDDDDATQE